MRRKLAMTAAAIAVVAAHPLIALASGIRFR